MKPCVDVTDSEHTRPNERAIQARSKRRSVPPREFSSTAEAYPTYAIEIRICRHKHPKKTLTMDGSGLEQEKATRPTTNKTHPAKQRTPMVGDDGKAEVV